MVTLESAAKSFPSLVVTNGFISTKSQSFYIKQSYKPFISHTNYDFYSLIPRLSAASHNLSTSSPVNGLT
jgi:hypothetical protein